jgi:hypothetical protein
MTRVGFGSCDEVSRSLFTGGPRFLPIRRRRHQRRNSSIRRIHNVSAVCIRDEGCDPLPVRRRRKSASACGDNGDGVRSAADVVAVAAEILDGDGDQVEAIARGDFQASPGVDANGDGRVDKQDAAAVAHRIFSGGA